MILAGTSRVQVSPDGIPFRVLRSFRDEEARRLGIVQTEIMTWKGNKWSTQHGKPDEEPLLPHTWPIDY